MTQATPAKKFDIQKLQRAIVDGLEDVKAQDIQVFNTEHLSPLFERVIVASGTSNRQTKALASSVRDAVRDAGFPKPRTEGEDNGEWIIVDCGGAVAHIMQPAIRTYYHLEEIWGDKPVRLKLGAPKPAAPAPAPVAAAAKKAPAASPSLRRSSAVKTAQRQAKAEDDAAKAAKSAKSSRSSKSDWAKPRSGAQPAGRAPVKTVVVKSATRPASKSAAGKSTAGKAPARKAAAPARKSPSKAPGRKA